MAETRGCLRLRHFIDEAPAAATELIWELPPNSSQSRQPPAKSVVRLTADALETRADRSQSTIAWLPAWPNPVRPRHQSRARWLFGGNTVLRVGVVLLFLGLAFLLRYATEGMVVPLELRYAGVAAAALGLLGLGWWLRTRNSNYALILQGAGIAVLYLTVFAAMRLHPLLDPRRRLACWWR